MEFALVLLWFVAFQALAFVALPVAARLFPGFPDRGAAFALPVALAVVTTVAYWVGHLAFGRWTAFLGVAVLAGLSAAVLWRDGTLRPASDVRGGAALPTRAYAETLVVFAIAFGFLVAVRAVDPAIVPGGGEKFLDFGIFQSLMRADALPPQDMWWAGGHVMYYYGGYLMAAILSFLTGTAPRYAYNLALAGFYASLVTAAYGLAGALADSRSASRRTGGVLGAFFVGFASNLVTAVAAVVGLLPDSIGSGLGHWIAVQLAGHRAGSPDIYSAEIVRKGLDAFGYWGPSRVIPHTINEFPLFAFLNGDLHGHMLSTQFLVLTAALGYAYYRTPPEATRRRQALVFGVFPPVVGLLGVVNVWSLPTGLGVLWLSLVFAPADPLSVLPGVRSDGRTVPVSDGGAVAERAVGEPLLAEARRVGAAFATTAVAGVLTVLWAAPFVAGILLAAAGGRGLGVLPTPTSAVGLVLVHGAFLAAFALYLWPRLRATFPTDPLRVGLLGVLLVAFAWLTGYPVLVLVVPLLVAGWLLVRADADAGYETVLIVAGAGLVTLVEFAYVKDNAASERLNTVFKVYMQVWALWGPAAGATLASLLTPESGPADWSLPSTGVSRSDVMVLVAAVLVVSTGLYGGLALRHHFTADGGVSRVDDPTLDGLAYVQAYHPDEAAAIRWLADRPGQPHILSAPGRSTYSWASPASSLTGIPTVIGWVWHEGIYRGHETARKRASDVDFFFRAAWPDKMEYLQAHDVKYVYVGPRARDRYEGANLHLDRFPGIEVAFRKGDVVIYRVTDS